MRYHPEVASYFAQRVLEQNRVSIQDFLLDFAETQWLRSGERRESRAAASDLCLDLLVAFLQIAVFAGEPLRGVRLAVLVQLPAALRPFVERFLGRLLPPEQLLVDSCPQVDPGLGQAFEQ